MSYSFHADKKGNWCWSDGRAGGPIHTIPADGKQKAIAFLEAQYPRNKKLTRKLYGQLQTMIENFWTDNNVILSSGGRYEFELSLRKLVRMAMKYQKARQ